MVVSSGCGPSLMDEPDDFTGNSDLSIGVLCGGETVTRDGDAWAKFEIRHGQNVTVSWDAESLDLRGGLLKRRAAGRPTTFDDSSGRRFETYWITAPPEAKVGHTVTVGPMKVPYKAASGGRQTHSSASCTFTLADE